MKGERGGVPGKVLGRGGRRTKMPQLDMATYMGQVTWLILVFVTYYRVVRGQLFPALTRVVKVRAKKKGYSQARTTSFGGEAKTVMEKYDRAVGKAALSALSLIQTEMDNQAAWSKGAVAGVTTKERAGVNSGYLRSVATVEARGRASVDRLGQAVAGVKDPKSAKGQKRLKSQKALGSWSGKLADRKATSVASSAKGGIRSWIRGVRTGKR